MLQSPYERRPVTCPSINNTNHMKLLSPATLGLAAAFLILNAAGTVSVYGQPSPSPTSSTAATSASPPNNVAPTSPLGQVIHLVQSGIDESIVQSYITNSRGTFNLDSDRIIYLTDLGVPTSLMTLMMQRDQAIQQQIASSQAAQPTQSEPATVPATSDSTASYASDPPPDGTDPNAQSVPPEVTVDYFNDNLSPYGTWVDVDGYGRCWRPTVVVYNHDWQPYGDHGRWINTDCGWYWQSGYAWNSTFHYGRWFRDASYGWCWWPDTVWAPSWVTWRYTDDACGWAPLPPFTVYRPGVGFMYRGNGISVGFDFGLNADSFIFVGNDHFYDPHPGHFRYPRPRIGELYGRSTVLNNLNLHEENGHHMVFNGGVPPQHFTQSGGGLIHPIAIHNLPNPYTGHNSSPGRHIGYPPISGNAPEAGRHYGNNNPGLAVPHDQPSGRNLPGNDHGNAPGHYANQPNFGSPAAQYPENNGVRTPVASGNYQPNPVNNGHPVQIHPAYPIMRPVQPVESGAPIVRNTPVNDYQPRPVAPAPVIRPTPVESGTHYVEPPRYTAPREAPAPVVVPQRPAPAPQPAPSSGGNHFNNNNQHGH